MPSTIGDSSLYSFDSLAKSAPLSPEADSASLNSPWRRTSWSRRDSSAGSMRSGHQILQPFYQLFAPHRLLRAAIEIAHRQRTGGEFVGAEQHRGTRTDSISAPHPPL